MNSVVTVWNPLIPSPGHAIEYEHLHYERGRRMKNNTFKIVNLYSTTNSRIAMETSADNIRNYSKSLLQYCRTFA